MARRPNFIEYLGRTLDDLEGAEVRGEPVDARRIDILRQMLANGMGLPFRLASITRRVNHARLFALRLGGARRDGTFAIIAAALAATLVWAENPACLYAHCSENGMLDPDDPKVQNDLQ